MRPAVGLLYNPSTPALLAHAPALVEHLSAMPDRMWFDFGDEPVARRFRHAQGAITELAALARGRSLAGHGLGLSLPSAMPLDEAMLGAVVAVAEGLRGFAWYSEHLSVFVTPGGAAVPNAQAGLGLPVVYGDESFELLCPKLRRLNEALGCRVLLENPAQFSPLTDLDCSEPEFLNRLYRAGVSGTLLDLHNLYVCQRNGVTDPQAYLEALDLDSVEEVHLAGGDEFGGFYMDSHATVTPPAVWELAHEFLPRCRRLRAITLEYQESYFEQIGLQALARELELMHELAERCTVEHPPC
ncbi:DUF692 family protein [Paucibacter sp. R3-3]|uniref:DUF692 family protein n=1 Tax=Roseateles agri TaxID=3098619 RepID=A0ABU5DLE7_9BURK|nr:DUF692 family multinuclear iron-containing protein [Paucibacter sp. R3-3]MDY0747111.1 DUF692 family protein [Paucibacter sp. R3-3]